LFAVAGEMLAKTVTAHNTNIAHCFIKDKWFTSSGKILLLFCNYYLQYNTIIFLNVNLIFLTKIKLF